MSYRIMYTNFGPHRNTKYLATVIVGETVDARVIGASHNVDDIQIIVAKLADEQWWIIPNNAFDEDKFVDVGPFDEVELAIVHLKLISKQTIFW